MDINSKIQLANHDSAGERWIFLGDLIDLF